jgi:ABC-type nickel/cobalt efflux system permease component RcnA
MDFNLHKAIYVCIDFLLDNFIQGVTMILIFMIGLFLTAFAYRYVSGKIFLSKGDRWHS